MKVSTFSTWEQLGSIQGWNELASHVDASPFAFPTFCLPWWYEAGSGRIASMAVEESGILVGLALTYDRVGDIGRHLIRFLGTEVNTYHQLLVADDRDDVAELLMESILSPGKEIDFTAVPLDLARAYEAATSCSMVLSEHEGLGLVALPLDDVAAPSSAAVGSIHRVTDPDECVELLARSEAQWLGHAPSARASAFFESVVDASARGGRLTLHVANDCDPPVSGLLIVHGAGTSAVWRHVGEPASEALVTAASVDAAERGSTRILWPASSGVPGKAFPLVDLVRAPSGEGHLSQIAGSVSSLVKGVKDYMAT
jgi:Acetyltransferase (GNAT) domain